MGIHRIYTGNILVALLPGLDVPSKILKAIPLNRQFALSYLATANSGLGCLCRCTGNLYGPRVAIRITQITIMISKMMKPSAYEWVNW